MDDVNVLTQTLNATLQRHARVVQGYEVEITNMTAEIIKLNAKVEELQSSASTKTKSDSNTDK
jgi:hypothetical protein